MTRSKLLGTACAAALLIGSAGPILASDMTPPPAPTRHWYASAFGGWVFSGNHEFDFVDNVTNASFAYTAPLDSGYAFGGAVGVIVNPNLRVELELNYSSQDFVNTYRSAFFTGQNPTGSLDVTTMTVNAWFNANLGQFQPYIGGGIGWGWVDGDLTVTNGSGAQFNGSDSGLAMMLGGGIRMPVASNVELDVGYRARRVFDINLGSAIGGFSTTNEDITTHTIQAGINFKF